MINTGANNTRVTPEVGTGVPLPLGAHQHGTGINFAIFSRHATGVSLLLFDEQHDAVPRSTIVLDPRYHRTGDIWHLWVESVGPGTLYAWRVDGAYAPEQGDRFDCRKILLDPYATVLAGTDCWDFAGAARIDELPADKDDAGARPKCLVPDNGFDWEGARIDKHITEGG